MRAYRAAHPELAEKQAEYFAEYYADNSARILRKQRRRRALTPDS